MRLASYPLLLLSISLVLNFCLLGLSHTLVLETNQMVCHLWPQHIQSFISKETCNYGETKGDFFEKEIC